MVKAREYQEEKEVFKAAKEQAKLDRKIKRAANALKKKLEEEEKKKRTAKKKAKAAQEKLAKELAAAAKKTPKKQPVSTAIKAKTAAPIVSKRQKALTKAKAPAKAVTRRNVVAVTKVVVA